jgi:hypothetical protein
MQRLTLIALLAGGLWFFAEQPALAQYGSQQLRTPNVQNLTSRAAIRQPRRANMAAMRPTVSPYLNLTNSPNPDQPTYQTLVRPQVDQYRQNSAFRSQLGQVNRNVNALASGGGAGAGAYIAPTGRSTGGGLGGYFGYKSHYYTEVGPR